ncbi:hypothetical protein V8F06_010246 [Rhypophila decipiens]
MGSIDSPQSRPKRVLMFTNSEHGQANVYLATSYALVTLPDEDVEVHFASFDPIQKFVTTTTEHAQDEYQKSHPQPQHPFRPIIFHKLAGISMMAAWETPEVLNEQASLNYLEANQKWWTMRSQVASIMRRMHLLLRVILPWSGPEFVEIFWSAIDIVHNVQPDIVAVDPAFAPALTALRHIDAKFVVLAPNTIKDFAMPLQPNGEALWKYPVTGKPYAYPVPGHQIANNVFLILLAIIISFFFDHRRKAIQEYVRLHADSAKLTTLNDLSLTPHLISRSLKFLVANTKKIEFPLRLIPGHIIPCGPMIRPAKAVGEVDPDLDSWLRGAAKTEEVGRGEQVGTVYVNLGTHMRFEEASAVELARGLRILLDHADAMEEKKSGRKLQVLWKLSRQPGWEMGPESRIYEMLGKEMDEDRIRIVDWIEAEPTAVLDSGGVVCVVHHGGANSFLETCCAGIPQVVLPVWMDTFDFARRAEILNIGRWGNQIAVGRICEGTELGSILVDVLLGPRSSLYAENASKIAEICREGGGGRVKAARHILAEIPAEEEMHQNDTEGQVEDMKVDEKEPLLIEHTNGRTNGQC